MNINLYKFQIVFNTFAGQFSTAANVRERAVRQTKSWNLAKPKTLWPPTCNSARFTRNQVTLLPNNLLQLNMENKYDSKHDLQKPKTCKIQTHL